MNIDMQINNDTMTNCVQSHPNNGNTHVSGSLLNIRNYFKIKLNWVLQKKADRNYFSWKKTGTNCKNGSYECQDTGIFCHLLEKQCFPLNCKHWRNRH